MREGPGPSVEVPAATGHGGDARADIEGRLVIETDPDLDDEGTFVVDDALGGDVLGEDGQAIRGDLSGTIQNVDAPSGPEPIGGDFVVER